MVYFVDIYIETPPGDGPAVIRLGPEFETLDDANAAGASYVEEMGLPPGGGPLHGDGQGRTRGRLAGGIGPRRLFLEPKP